VSDQSESRPFDEQAALAELERLAQKIQVSRRQRAEAVAEFDAFVRAFREPAGTSQAASLQSPQSRVLGRAPGPELHPALDALDEGVKPNVPVFRPAEPIRNSAPPKSDPWTPVVSPLTLPAPPQKWWLQRNVLALGGVLAVAGGVALVWSLFGTSNTPAANQSPSLPAAAPASAPAPSAAPATTAPARAVNVELTTVRPVWMRVIVDDRKTMEREFPADARIPIGADRSIVVRAGDGGAVRVTQDGKDLGPMGRNGFAVTRVWPAPQGGAR
jgi:hypothetical protein